MSTSKVSAGIKAVRAHRNEGVAVHGDKSDKICPECNKNVITYPETRWKKKCTKCYYGEKILKFNFLEEED